MITDHARAHPADRRHAPAVWQHTRGAAARAPRPACRGCWGCTPSPRSPPSPRRGWSAGSSTWSADTGATRGTVDQLAIGLAVAVVAQTGLTWAARRLSFILGETVFAQLREQFVGRAVNLPLSTVERAGTGDLVARTTNDVEALSHVVRFGIPSLFVAVDDGAR